MSYFHEYVWESEPFHPQLKEKKLYCDYSFFEPGLNSKLPSDAASIETSDWFNS